MDISHYRKRSIKWNQKEKGIRKMYEEDLRRIGIDEELIVQEMRLQDPLCGMCRIRKILLEQIHKEQKKLQELDYLIYKERKEGHSHG